MNQLPVLVIKMLNGGLFVVAFALLGEMLRPKRFAGLFSAAPSVALANMTVVIATQGHRDAIANTRGMVVGAAAFALSALAGIVFVRRYRSRLGSALIAAPWLAIAGIGYRGVLA
jgi:uncharacterized membrane protein (GlpM family)